MPDRVPIVRRDPDGRIVDGTAELTFDEDGVSIGDFRDLDGRPLPLPPGAAYETTIDLSDYLPGGNP